MGSYKRTTRQRPLAERFWEKVDKRGPEECWPWLGVRARGYGKIAPGGGRRVHRNATHVSYEIHKGPIPAGMRVLHRCDNPPCVNPEHLFLGTARDNTQDMVSKMRHCHGDAHPEHRLSDEAVAEIRRLKAAGVTYDELEQQFGVTRAPLHRIVTGTSWRHVDAPTVRAKALRRVSDEEVREIRCLRALGIPLAWIADLYGVSAAAVSTIARGLRRAA